MLVRPDGPRPKIGVVLGSGGIKCAAAIGLWKVLQREGLEVDFAVGCSGGSLYAAAMALGWDQRTIAEQSVRLWEGLFSQVNYAGLLRAIFAGRWGLERWGLVDDRRVNAVISGVYQDATFAGTRLPLSVVATDQRTGYPVVLTEGRIADAVRASSAVPFVLPPWPLNGRLLMDGGASDPLPIGVAVRAECDIILAMGFENPYPPRLDSLFNLFEQLSHIVVNNLIRSTLALYDRVHGVRVIPILPRFDRYIRMSDTHLIPSIIAEGERAAEKQLPLLRQVMAQTLPRVYAQAPVPAAESREFWRV